MRALWAALADLSCVLAFVVIGRANHQEDGALLGLLSTAWPFVTALAAGWLIARAWRAPTAPLSTGGTVWAVTLLGGLLLRLLAGDGAPLSFALVTACFLSVTLLGWRALAHWVLRSRLTPRTPAAPRR